MAVSGADEDEPGFEGGELLSDGTQPVAVAGCQWAVAGGYTDERQVGVSAEVARASQNVPTNVR